jgi:hypothetical protein
VASDVSEQISHAGSAHEIVRASGRRRRARGECRERIAHLKSTRDGLRLWKLVQHEHRYGSWTVSRVSRYHCEYISASERPSSGHVSARCRRSRGAAPGGEIVRRWSGTATRPNRDPSTALTAALGV